jgi:hypothetical protein
MADRQKTFAGTGRASDRKAAYSEESLEEGLNAEADDASLEAEILIPQ